MAAPTSTLPQPQPSGHPTDAATDVDIPEYETDLDLTPEEEEAVDGALVAFVGYFRTVNEAYSGEFASAKKFPDFASGDALDSINGDVEVIKNGSYEFSGTVTPKKIKIDQVVADDGAAVPNNVTLQFCFDLSQWSLLPQDESPEPSESDLITMEHIIHKSSDGWRVNEQTLRERKC
ncbi:hypothetical protein [Brevibacterium renqingii]|uniref:hypothetical protein n=1 Tax=Brevibacterium renqingii TaxID=2776916 RepID=UPI001ADF9B22|nr:hypothetical protein [Brevibacterium renqingii]